MATLEEILELDKVQSSIKKIDLFLMQKTKYSKEYMAAIGFKALVLYELHKPNDALKLLYEYVPELKMMDNDSIIALCNAIIEITIGLGIYEQAAKYIKIKREALPISRQSEYIKDTTTLYLAKKDYENAKEALKDYLEDDISYEEEIYALEELAKLYYQERDYDKYLATLPKLNSHYQTTLNIEKQEEIAKNQIEIAYQRKNYIKVVLDGQRFFSEYKVNRESSLLIASRMIKSYIAVSDYKKASIVESNYEEYVTVEYPYASLEFCYAALELYNKTNTASSVIEYRRRIEEIERETKEEIPVKKTKRTKKQEEIVVPNIEDVLPKFEETETYLPNLGILNPKEEVSLVQTQKVVVDIKSTKNLFVSEAYDKIAGCIDALNHISKNQKFREAFRRISIEITKLFPIEELYVFYFDSTYKGLHYKMERCYDKKLDIDALEGTLGYKAYEMDSIQFLDASDFTYSKNIVTGKDYESDTYAVSFPLHDDVSAIGSITYISHTPFLAVELCYEALLFITKSINVRLRECLEREAIEEKNQKLIFLSEKMNTGIKENKEGYYHFSSYAQALLGVMENLYEPDYFIHMDSEDIRRYKEITNEIYTLQTEGLEMEYSFKREDTTLRIKEKFYPFLKDGMIEIYSLLDDITEEYRDKKNLIQLAYQDSISHLDTLVKLRVDIEDYAKKDLALAIIDVYDSKLYRELYGLNFYNQIITAVGDKLKKAFSSNFNFHLYHIEGTTYALLMQDIHDKRVMDSILKKGLDEAKQEMFALNHRVLIHLNAGVYRVSGVLHNPEEMIYYAQDALLDAVELDSLGNHVCHYDSKLSQQRFYQNNIVTSISEAIEFNKLSVLYKQIINLERTSVYGFTLSLNMDSFEIEEKEMMRIVQRRGMVSQMEKYMIRTAFKELKLFYGEMKSFLNLFIPVSNETIGEHFIEFLTTQAKFFNINPAYITFIVDTVTKDILGVRELGYHIASKDIYDIYRNSCDIFLYDIHTAPMDAAYSVMEVCKAHSISYILSGIDTQEDMDYARRNGFLLAYGNYYKNKRRMKDLLEKQKKK